ncbi:MAG: class I SAM-dependent methyltransferase [Armatimonadota bacterium]
MKPVNVCPICACSVQEALTLCSEADAQAPQIVRCKSCRYIYRSNPSSSPQPDWSQRREELFQGTPDELSEVMYRRRLALVERAVVRGALLDFGCGPGRFLEIAHQHGWQVAGIETACDDYAISPLLAEKISSLFMEGLWPAGSFDAVTIWRVLELCRNPIELIHMAAHYCRVDGVLLVQMQNAESTGKHQDWSSDERMRLADCLYSPQALHRFLGRFGFRIESIQQGPMPQHDEIGVFAHAHHAPVNALSGTKSAFHATGHAAELLTVTARYIP